MTRLVEYINESVSFHYSMIQLKAFLVTCYTRPTRIFLNRAEKQQNVILLETMSLPGFETAFPVTKRTNRNPSAVYNLTILIA